VRLTVSRDFFLQFASKTWLSPFSIIRELVEDCYDEDATRVIVTLAENYAVIEGDVGMDSEALEKFLIVGSIHKQFEPYLPRFNRPRTGRYVTDRLSFLAFFKAMKVKTRKRGFSASNLVDEECVAGLAEGSSQAKVLNEPTLDRDGSEIWLLNAKSTLDVKRIIKGLSGGRDFLVRYVLRIVASVLAAEKCPQQTEALEEANKLIAEALKRL